MSSSQSGSEHEYVRPPENLFGVQLRETVVSSVVDIALGDAGL